jgi:hypothetical protein
MKKPKYIIKYVTKYIYSDKDDCIYEVIRPVVKMLVLGLFYITIKEFFCKNKQIAEISAKTLLDNLNKPYDYE